MKWYLILKDDGRVFAAFEHEDGTAGAGLLNDEQREALGL